jgi:hypothetical protein
VSADPQSHFDVRSWLDAAKAIDSVLKPGDLVAVQSGSAFPVVLGSLHPQRFLIDSDHDYEELLSLRPFPANYLFRTSGSDSSRYGASFEAAFQDPGGQPWKPVLVLPVGTLFHRDIDPQSSRSSSGGVG